MKTLFNNTPSKPPPLVTEVRFNRFWAAYPRKVAIGRARKVWAKLKPDEPQTQKMIAAIKAQALAYGWYRDKTYCPHPTTWLNGERWDDEVEIPAVSQQSQLLTAEDIKRKYNEVF